MLCLFQKKQTTPILYPKLLVKINKKRIPSMWFIVLSVKKVFRLVFVFFTFTKILHRENN